MSASTVYHVRRCRHDLEKPWRIPDGVESVPLVLSGSGRPCRLRTEFAIYHDGSRLFVLFTADDDHVVASKLDHDADLWEEDVVEVFLAPDGLARYFELEVNPLGTTYDAEVDSPDGKRESMKVDRSWTCEGMRASIRRVAEGDLVIVDTMLAIPFSSLGRDAPEADETWRANLFRVDRSPSGDEFSAWCPTGRTPPDFHVPARFGMLRFD